MLMCVSSHVYGMYRYALSDVHLLYLCITDEAVNKHMPRHVPKFNALCFERLAWPPAVPSAAGAPPLSAASSTANSAAVASAASAAAAATADRTATHLSRIIHLIDPPPPGQPLDEPVTPTPALTLTHTLTRGSRSTSRHRTEPPPHECTDARAVPCATRTAPIAVAHRSDRRFAAVRVLLQALRIACGMADMLGPHDRRMAKLRRLWCALLLSAKLSGGDFRLCLSRQFGVGRDEQPSAAELEEFETARHTLIN